MKNVEDVYPLSPMQEFMLFHSVSRRHADVLFEQFCFELEQPVDDAAFEAAWQSLLDRHAMLRTAFIWEQVKHPLQVVRGRVTIPFERLDWSDVPEATRRQKLEALRRADREEGFDPRRAPLLRVKLIRLHENSYLCLWSSHHLLLDRWCLTPLLSELQRLYGAHAHRQPPALPPAASFRDYIRWIQRQDRGAAEAFWARRLTGVRAGARLTLPRSGEAMPGIDPGAPSDEALRESSFTISDAALDGLRSFARGNGTTLGIAVQAAWALALNRILDEPEPVFGLAVAGRPADVPGIEGMLGSFVNNLPIRVTLRGDALLKDVLLELQAAQLATRPFEYLGPAELVRLARLPPDQVLFDHLLVWLAPESPRREGELVMRHLPGTLRTAYPLTVGIAESPDTLTFMLHLTDGYRCRVPLVELADTLRDVISQMVSAGSGARLATLPDFVGAAAPNIVHSPTSAPEVLAGSDGTTDRAGRLTGEQSMVEDMLVSHWSEMLGRAITNRGASIFDLGATSLSAVAVHARVQTSLRREVPLLAMFEDPSITGMARTLIRADWPLRDGMRFPLREQGERTPLFCIASPEVDTLGFVLLTRHLPANQPVYLIQAPPDADAIRRITPLELPALCEGYTEAIRELQPSGPYQLLGNCTGAQMSVEIAHQLNVAGESIGFLGIIHTWGFYTVSRRRYLYRWLNQARYLHRRLVQVLSTTVAGSAVQPAGPGTGTGTPDLAEQQRATPDAEPARELEVDDARSTRLWLEDFGWPENDPGQPRLAGPLVLFRNRNDSEQRYWRVRDPLMGWGRQAVDVRVEHLPGRDVLAILREPHVRALASAVGRHLTDEPNGDEE